MSCLTCDHTMQKVNDGNPPVFWCPRCGTIKTGSSLPKYEPPMLVQRALALCTEVTGGIAECIDLAIRNVRESTTLPQHREKR